MTEETKDFIENWEAKAALIDIGDLNGLFNRFTTVYTIYNRLYNESYSILGKQGKLAKPRYSDFETATVLVVEFLTAQKIIDRISQRGLQKDVAEICYLIKNEVFNINLEKGNPRKDKDNILLNNLQSKNVEVQAQAILSLIYNIRNNIVHGYKDFVEYQRLIVEPMAKLLETINGLYKEELSV